MCLRCVFSFPFCVLSVFLHYTLNMALGHAHITLAYTLVCTLTLMSTHRRTDYSSSMGGGRWFVREFWGGVVWVCAC